LLVAWCHDSINGQSTWRSHAYGFSYEWGSFVFLSPEAWSKIPQKLSFYYDIGNHRAKGDYSEPGPMNNGGNFYGIFLQIILLIREGII
jgi:hypothetical protein